MIDKLVLRCFFKTDGVAFDLRKLSIPLVGSLDADGRLHNLRHAWESIPTSYAGLAFKIFYTPESSIQPEPYIEIKASPAKIAQGHNVYGSDDIRQCALLLIEALTNAYPQVVGDLDIRTWHVAEVDITYFSRASNQREAEAFIDALSRVSKGHTQARGGVFRGTAYFGKTNSRLKRIKVYAKYLELLRTIEEAKEEGDPFGVLSVLNDELLQFAQGMIRWEVSLKKRWFERRGVPTNLFKFIEKWSPVEWWTEATADLFAALEGEKMAVCNDEDVLNALKAEFFTVSATGRVSYRAALAAYNSYRDIKRDGWRAWVDATPERTRYRHVGMLHGIGLSHVELQNMRGEKVSNIIPFVRYVGVDFGAQFPEWVKQVA